MTLPDLASALVAKRLVAWERVWGLSLAEIRMLASFLNQHTHQPPGIADLNALMTAFPDTQTDGPIDERA